MTKLSKYEKETIINWNEAENLASIYTFNASLKRRLADFSRKYLKEIRRYATIEELDEAVLNRLISRILIGEVKKVDGQKVQEVRIVYNFVGEIPEIAA